MKERDGWADSLRAVCMLWIICVAHMDEYLGRDWSSFPILLITRGIFGYIEQKITELNPDKAGSNIVGLAMGIQKGKYDGTDEALAKCTNEAGGTRE